MNLQFQQCLFVLLKRFYFHLRKVDDRFKMDFSIRTSGSILRCLVSKYILLSVLSVLHKIKTKRCRWRAKVPFRCSLCTFRGEMVEIWQDSTSRLSNPGGGKNFFALSSSKLRNVLCASVPTHPLGQLFGIADSYLSKWREICACCANNTRENKMDSVFPVFAVREPEVSFYYAKQFICYISLLFFKSVEKQLQTEHMQCGHKSVRRNLLHEDRAWKSWDSKFINQNLKG